MRRHVRLTAVAILLIGALCARAGEKKDRHGDPLPVGAIARMGTTRWVHGGDVWAVAYSPDGKLLASAGDNKQIRLWDAETGKEIKTLEGHTGSVRGLAFVPPAKGKPCTQLVSGSYDRTVRVWNLTSGKEDRVVQQAAAVGAVAVSHDGKTIASGTVEPAGNVYVWNLADGKELQSWQAHVGRVYCLAFSLDGKQLVSGGNNRAYAPPKQDPYALAVWDPATGKKIHLFDEQDMRAHSVAFSGDGRWLASAGIGSKTISNIHVWDAKTFKNVRLLKGPRGQDVTAHALAFSPDSKSLAAASYSDAIYLWGVGDGALLQTIPKHGIIESMAFSADGKMLARAGTDNSNIGVWDIDKRQARHPRADHHSEIITGLAVSCDGKRIATGSHDKTGRTWELSSGKFLREFRGPKLAGPLVWSVAFSPDDKVLAMSHQNQGITLWNPDDGTLLRQIDGPRFGRVVALAFSPDGKTLASESIDDGGAKLWDPENGAAIRTFPRLKNRGGHSVAFSGDGKWLASAGDQVYVWNAATGQLRLQLRHAASAVAYSKDNKLVASAGFSDVRLWDADTGNELAKFEEKRLIHPGQRALAFSPDSGYLAVTHLDRIRVLDVKTRQEIASLRGHRATVTSVAFTPDGTTLVSVSADCTALVWDLKAILGAKK